MTIDIDYSTYEIVESDIIPQEILEILQDSEYADEVESSTVKVREVQAPFYLADNVFDLRECNNDILEEGVERVSQYTFTGGAFLIEYKKTSEISFVLQGNTEEGYNIFIIK